ncbi:type II toxin-antitoxin system RelB/DinJ family antitoxin [Bifidobacterium sp. ESL0682]|uniref:type II toxin-antitoxin system RelB/DinJ family antitoxin n=1 Tax=Bifidobacterium sp. ESL0682 TaxID=2983212 RepID=UPI0023F91C70|nr:type II toxin-antitoxin system RelB/DinJ family antitoxin [Bifidobacterium sp. ESL0682]WEV41671.1 type II toxin-antitoxin system RelB/DinJ family antitoxin [Bifidobacterium sp. ESL0682]
MAQATVNQTRIQIRTSKTLKDQATEVFADMGIDLTAAINMFLSQAVKEGGMPFKPMALTPSKKPCARQKTAASSMRETRMRRKG